MTSHFHSIAISGSSGRVGPRIIALSRPRRAAQSRVEQSPSLDGGSHLDPLRLRLATPATAVAIISIDPSGIEPGLGLRRTGPLPFANPTQSLDIACCQEESRWETTGTLPPRHSKAPQGVSVSVLCSAGQP